MSEFYIDAVKTGSNQTIYTIHRVSDDKKVGSYYLDEILINGKTPVSTPYGHAHSSNYYVDGDIETAVNIKKTYINKRYELKNKALHNINIPLTIDDDNMSEFEPLIEENLYEAKFDTKIDNYTMEIRLQTVTNEFPFDTRIDNYTMEIRLQTVTNEFPFETRIVNEKLVREYGYGVTSVKPFYIDHVEYSRVDSLMMPMNIKSVTRPIVLSPHSAFIFFVDIVYQIHDRSKVRITEFSDTRFEISDIENRKRIITMSNWSNASNLRSNDFKEPLYFVTFNDMIIDINTLARNFNNALNSGSSTSQLHKLIVDFREKHSIQSW